MSSSRSQSPAPSRQPPSTPRQSSRRSSTQPTRAKQQHPHQQQMHSLLSPPRSPKVDSPPPSSASPRHSHSSSSLVPTVQLDQAKHDDSKRRRRHKQNRAETPLKHEASLSSSSSDELPPATTATAAAAQEDTSASSAATPSKSARRRRGKATRQPSPPPHDGTQLEPAPSFPSSTPPQTDLGALAHHSRSVPPDPFLQAPRFDAAWDMPAFAASGTDSPKQSLSWQQELLRSGSTRSATRGDSPVSRPRSRGVSSTAKDSRSSAQASSSTATKSRPTLHTSHSETGTTGAGPSLNWQQELLLSMDPAQQPQPSQAQQQQQQLGAPAGITPARQRRNQIKDSITFGLANVDLSEDDADVFASPGSRRGGHAGASRGGRSTQSSSAPTSFATPPRAPQQAAPAGLVEPRYAGPTFHNSPAPSSLPMPSFMLRRKVDVAV
ncbi:hypothetical protein JCM9279_007433 [Rhodotorula babjevae]